MSGIDTGLVPRQEGQDKECQCHKLRGRVLSVWCPVHGRKSRVASQWEDPRYAPKQEVENHVEV